MSYVPCLDIFIDLKPLISQVMAPLAGKNYWIISRMVDTRGNYWYNAVKIALFIFILEHYEVELAETEAFRIIFLFMVLYQWFRSGPKMLKVCRKKKFFRILWKSRGHILVTFHFHLKKLRSILTFWLEKLNCGFFHSFHSSKNTTKQLFLSKFQCRK